MTLIPAEIRIAPGEMTTIRIDGVSVARQTLGLTIEARPDEIPRVSLEMAADFTFDGDADVEFTILGPDVADIADWIRGLDPAALQAAVYADPTRIGDPIQGLVDLIADHVAAWGTEP